MALGQGIVNTEENPGEGSQDEEHDGGAGKQEGTGDSE
jgi:hypothetical protein